MLTVPEKVAFLVAIAITGWLAYRAILRLVRIIGRGRGRPDWRAVPPG